MAGRASRGAKSHVTAPPPGPEPTALCGGWTFPEPDLHPTATRPNATAVVHTNVPRVMGGKDIPAEAPERARSVVRATQALVAHGGGSPDDFYVMQEDAYDEREARAHLQEHEPDLLPRLDRLLALG